MKFQFDYLIDNKNPNCFDNGKILNYDNDVAKRIALSGIADCMTEINETYGLSLAEGTDINKLDLRILNDGLENGNLFDDDNEVANHMEIYLNGVRFNLFYNATPKNSASEPMALGCVVSFYHANSSLRMCLHQEN